jgi:hypothetical protein
VYIREVRAELQSSRSRRSSSDVGGVIGPGISSDR